MTDQEFERMFDKNPAAQIETADFAALQAQWWNEQAGNLGYLDCPLCKNKGYVFKVYDGNDVMNRGVVVTEECACMARRRNLERIEKSGLTESIRSMTFETYAVNSGWQSHVKIAAKDYVNRGGSSWFLIGGQVGSGKTHICTAIVGELMKRGKSVIYLPFREKIPQIKRLALESVEYGRMMSQWQTCDVLYIDDLFKGKVTDADVSILFELLDYRYRNYKQTIISTEKTLEELDEVDEAISSRIKQRCGKYKLDVGHGEDRNMRKRLDENERRREA